ncbi:hypothetical protein ACTFIW_003339 [Dictyostelium discoideum]
MVRLFKGDEVKGEQVVFISRLTLSLVQVTFPTSNADMSRKSDTNNQVSHDNDDTSPSSPASSDNGNTDQGDRSNSIHVHDKELFDVNPSVSMDSHSSFGTNSTTINHSINNSRLLITIIVHHFHIRVT